MHTNPEVLALLAIGDQSAVSQDDRDHIAGCEVCSAEVVELAHLAGVGRSTDAQMRIESPSPEVWRRIATELGLEESASAVTASQPAANGAHPTPGTIEPAAATPVAAPTPIGSAHNRRRRHILVSAVAAALALIVGVVGGIAWERRTPPETVVAQADLNALPDWAGARGQATLERDSAGNQVLVVTVQTPRPVDGLQEVWLIDPSVKGMQSIGLLTQPTQRFQVPAGLDVTQFPIVDVSAEPPNGVPAHSGDSIVRGTLDI
jgi:Anti-sigma-K factor rskA, C-terminal